MASYSEKVLHPMRGINDLYRTDSMMLSYWIIVVGVAHFVFDSANVLKATACNAGHP